MKKIITICFFALLSSTSYAQLSTLSNNKPLGFLNPALQNYEMERGVVSASALVNPLAKESDPVNFLVLAEYKVNDKFRVGIHGSKVENRLNSNNTYKAYLSYKLELEQENYLIIGGDIGTYKDVVKTSEFNKVYAPNKFKFNDSIANGIDLGLGIAYHYNGFTFGVGFSKLNSPEVVLFPVEMFEKIYVGSDSTFGYKDTTVNEEFGKYGLQSNINVMYEWELNENITMFHSVQFGNVDLAGMDYFGFQNIARINDRHAAGLGMFYNGELGIIATGGYGITEDIKLEASAFFAKDLNYNTSLGEYENDGYKPSLEFNIRYEF